MAFKINNTHPKNNAVSADGFTFQPFVEYDLLGGSFYSDEDDLQNSLINGDLFAQIQAKNIAIVNPLTAIDELTNLTSSDKQFLLKSRILGPYKNTNGVVEPTPNIESGRDGYYIETISQDYDLDTLFSKNGKAVYIGGAGNLDVLFAAVGGSTISFKNLLAGTILPIQIREIKSTSTVTDIVVLF